MSWITRLFHNSLPPQQKGKPVASNGKSARPVECAEAEKLVEDEDFQQATNILVNAVWGYLELGMIKEATFCLAAIRITVYSAPKGTVTVPIKILQLYQDLVGKQQSQ